MSDEIRAKIEISQPRRWLGVGMLFCLGALLIYVAFATPPSLQWQAFLLGVGTAALWLAEKMRRATAGWIEMTDAVLRDQDGTLIATLDEIENVERGMLAFKPSNGFLMKTTHPAPNHWSPGLWWRIGRRVGVGGVTPSSQGKVMADLISTRIVLKQQGLDDPFDHS